MLGATVRWQGGGVDVAAVVEEKWGLGVQGVEELTGGMNSAAWLVVGDGGPVVAKVVEAGDLAFGAGLELAGRLGDAGLVTGRPVLSRAGRVVERVGGRQVGVLEFVEGVPLEGAAADQVAIGTTLGRVHEVSSTAPGGLEDWLQLVTQFDEWLDLEEWIRPAVATALDGVRELNGLSWAWLHGDPAAEAFLRQRDGTIALIDWGSAMRGPILYDVASAVMYAGTAEHVVRAYVEKQQQAADEIESGLEAFLNLRYAVQAGYFAWRCSTDVRTGLTDPAENRKGLADARPAFGF
ncbi:homoserine kinase type II [Kribbella antiqua]|uniref:Homoserine kinase type II n=1 Tax=Kribbella antiqua TaxID=2512217 RepID=A0A4V2S4I4_9ACTN|nr:homoserine kinase type II [Kribbella antiqua]